MIFKYNSTGNSADSTGQRIKKINLLLTRFGYWALLFRYVSVPTLTFIGTGRDLTCVGTCVSVGLVFKKIGDPDHFNLTIFVAQQ